MCGIVGFFSHSAVAAELYESLIHLQHRGQDAAGMITSGSCLRKLGGIGLVREVFDHETLTKLKGDIGLAHVRYTTCGSADNHQEIQPFFVNHPYEMAIVHNGHIINSQQLAAKLQHTPQYHLHTDSDSEILLNLFANNLEASQNSLKTSDFFTTICAAVSSLYETVQGSYSIISLIVNKGLIAYRDPHGIRPLVYGVRQSSSGKSEYIFASEPTMFRSLGFEEIHNVKPGEVIYVDEQGHLHKQLLCKKTFCPCMFEYIYFARPDAELENIAVYEARVKMGQKLALRWREMYPEIIPEVVIPVPSTANTAALAFAHQLEVRYAEGLYNTPFIGRTFIMPNQVKREEWVSYKFSPLKTEIKDKKILVVDDSIVRGTTSKTIVRLLRDAGAKEVYLVSICPPIRFPCLYGIDIATHEELLATKKTMQEISDFLGVDKLLYQTVDDVITAVGCQEGINPNCHCIACCDGVYPTN